MYKLTIIISHLQHEYYDILLSLAYDSYILHNNGLKKFPASVENNLKSCNILTNLGEENFLEFKFYDKKDQPIIGNVEMDFSRNPHQVPTYSIHAEKSNQIVVYSGDAGQKM